MDVCVYTTCIVCAYKCIMSVHCGYVCIDTHACVSIWHICILQDLPEHISKSTSTLSPRGSKCFLKASTYQVLLWSTGQAPSCSTLYYSKAPEKPGGLSSSLETQAVNKMKTRLLRESNSSDCCYLMQN